MRNEGAKKEPIERGKREHPDFVGALAKPARSA
jgi:hypothetical protein